MSKLIQIFYSPSSKPGQSGKISNKNTPMDQHLLMKKFIPLVALFLICILGSLYFISSYSDIETLSVDGNNEVLDQQVINSSGIQSGNSLWGTYWQRSEVEERIITELPQVSDVSVRLSGINDLTFEVEEYRTVAYISEDSGYLKVLENGVVLENEYTTSLGNFPIFLGFEEGSALNRIIVEFRELDPTVQDLISEVEHIESEHNPMLVRAYMNNGNQVLASIPSFAERMSYYPQMVQAVDGQHGVFDLEAGAFFIPFVNNDPETDELDEEAEVDLENISE
jgi:cell division protein FtsQ